MQTKNNPMDDFAVFILTNGRPNKVKTYNTLKKCGYTGKVYLIVDDLDSTKEKYQEKFGDKVIIFDKKKIAKTFDSGDNFQDMRAIIYARNASFEIAKDLGIKYFIELDDDYSAFEYRYNDRLEYSIKPVKNVDGVLACMLRYYIRSGAASLALSQGGDFIGGSQNQNSLGIRLNRKCMNTFICSTTRPFQFIGRVNEDVNTYTRSASTGLLMLTTTQVNVVQGQTQTNKGGMTEMYLDSGTYIKSFYSVMYSPSSVKINMIRYNNTRIHHSVKWKHAVPMILSESAKKT